MDTLEDLTDVMYAQNYLKEISTLNDHFIIDIGEINVLFFRMNRLCTVRLCVLFGLSVSGVCCTISGKRKVDYFSDYFPRAPPLLIVECDC